MAHEPEQPGGAWSTEELLPDPLPASPLPIFRAWFDEAAETRNVPNPNAFTLATADPDGSPHARIVLCKALHEAPGFLVFYTNYQGNKGRQLAANPRAAATFHWDHHQRQVRVEGPVVRSPAEESDAYFASRHWTKRIGAWASDQSRPIGSHDELIAKVGEAIDRLGIDLAALAAIEEGGPDVTIPRPPHWGGFRLWAERVELWCGGQGRIHDRAVWTRELHPDPGQGFTAGAWSAERLQP